MRAVLLYVFLPLVLLLVAFYWWAQGHSVDNELLHQEIAISPIGLQREDSTFSVMTYNLGYLSGMTNNLAQKPSLDLFETNLEAARSLIKKWDPDLVGFQEIDFASNRSYNRNQLDSLSDGFAYAVQSVNWNKKYVPFPYWPPKVHFGRMLSGQAVLSKFRVIQSQRLVLPGPEAAPFYYKAFYLDRLIQVVELEVKGREVILLNVHLEAFDQATRELQAREVMQVVETYCRQYPTLLIGDFNARPPFATEQVTEEETIRIFTEHPLLSPALPKSQYLKNEQQHFTFDTAKPYEKLDYIFFTHQTIEPIETITLHDAGEISDHFPLLMRFKLTNR
jgi:endonuclease/exonuclease/phosphatase family metal-dependent hydrolase